MCGSALETSGYSCSYSDRANHYQDRARGHGAQAAHFRGEGQSTSTNHRRSTRGRTMTNPSANAKAIVGAIFAGLGVLLLATDSGSAAGTGISAQEWIKTLIAVVATFSV